MSSPAARRFFDSDDPVRWGRQELGGEREVTLAWLKELRASGPTLELGCGHAPLRDVLPRYVGLDLAFAPLRSLRPGAVNGDMEQLPFRDGSIGFIITWAALEHVPNPELVVSEIERVLGPGGHALLAPAWHCRPWAAEGLEFRPYSELTPRQRLRKRLIPLRGSIAWRGLLEIPRRIWRELRALFSLPRFEYGRLQPNLEQYLGTDSDAFTSLDPQSCALYFAARGWSVVSHPTFARRMLARHEPVVVQKPA